MFEDPELVAATLELDVLLVLVLALVSNAVDGTSALLLVLTPATLVCADVTVVDSTLAVVIAALLALVVAATLPTTVLLGTTVKTPALPVLSVSTPCARLKLPLLANTPPPPSAATVATNSKSVPYACSVFAGIV